MKKIGKILVHKEKKHISGLLVATVSLCIVREKIINVID